MASADTNIADNVNPNGFMGGFGGGGLILLLLFLGFLFKGRDGHGDHGHKWDGDEPNWAQDARNTKHMMTTQLAHELRNADEARKQEVTTIKEHDATRDLIRATEFNRVKDERDQERAENGRLKAEMFATALNAGTNAHISRLEAALAALGCRLPIAPPQYFATREQCTAPPPRCDVRRGGCGDFDGDFV